MDSKTLDTILEADKTLEVRGIVLPLEDATVKATQADRLERPEFEDHLDGLPELAEWLVTLDVGGDTQHIQVLGYASEPNDWPLNKAVKDYILKRDRPLLETTGAKAQCPHCGASMDPERWGGTANGYDCPGCGHRAYFWVWFNSDSFPCLCAGCHVAPVSYAQISGIDLPDGWIEAEVEKAKTALDVWAGHAPTRS